MHFDERTEGDYRIYVGALEAPRGDGYTATVVVNRIHGSSPTGREIYRDEGLACGHRWASAHDAMVYAIAQARSLIRSKVVAQAG